MRDPPRLPTAPPREIKRGRHGTGALFIPVSFGARYCAPERPHPSWFRVRESGTPWVGHFSARRALPGWRTRSADGRNVSFPCASGVAVGAETSVAEDQSLKLVTTEIRRFPKCAGDGKRGNEGPGGRMTASGSVADSLGVRGLAGLAARHRY